MKKIILTVFSTLLYLSSFGQWITQGSLGLNPLNGAHFTSSTTGFAVDAGGAIFNTNDAGVTWTSIYTASYALNTVFFSNANTGFVAGANGSFYKTSDGGITWAQQSTGQGYALNSIYFIDKDTGYAVGANGTILKTYTGGATWNPQTSGTSNILRSVYFTDATTGWAVGISGTILKTTDCGNTWLTQVSGAGDLYSVCFLNATSGYAGGIGGTLEYTNDGGANWYSIYSATVNSIYCIRFIDAYHGYTAGASGAITRTNDAGNMWYAQTTSTSNDLNSIVLTDMNNGVAVGNLGTVLKTTDGGCAGINVTISGTSTICSGDSTTLTATGAQDYKWDANGGNAITDTTRIAPFSSTAVLVVGTSSDGCVDSAFYNITVNSLPVISTFGGSPICAGNTATLTVSGATTYTWSNSSTGNTIAVSPGVTTTYSVTGSDANSCVNTDTLTVTVMPSPATPAVVNNGPVCEGQSIAFTASNVGGATYNWVGPNSFSSALQNPVIPATTVLDAGTYSVTATVAGCTSGVGTTAVTINPLPTVTVGGSPSVCSGGGLNVSVSGALSYVWSPTTGLSCSTCANPLANPSTTTNYTISGTNANGCTNNTTFTFTVYPLPGITTTPNDITCNGLCNGSTSAIPSGGSPPYTYLWSTSATTAGITNLCAGNYTVTVTEANGCSSTVTSPINQPTALNASIGTYTNALCLGVNNGIANENSSGGTAPYTYLWMPSGETTPTATNLATGTVSLTVTDAQGCSNASAFFLSATNTASVTVSGPANLCQGQTGQLTYSITGATAPYMNDWYDYATWSSFCMADTSLFTPLIPFSGQDTIKLTVTDNNGCMATDYKYITVGYGDSLSGNISDPTLNPVSAGIVYLFQQKTNHVGLYDTLSTTPINANGTYSFPNVPYGDYFLKVEADTSAGLYPLAVGTYYSNKPNAFQWDSALVINHYTCAASNVGGYTVTILETTPPGGPGIISGYITAGPGYGQRLSSGHNTVMGAPLKGVDIKLGKNPGGSPAARTTSDTTSGFYSFTNIPVGSYKIYVDIPNYGMDSVLNITISSTSNVSTQNNYYVDSVMIRVDSAQYVGVSPITHLPTQIYVYPNPGHGNVHIVSSEELGLITVYNSLGEAIFKEKINSTQHLIDLGKQAAGIYILQAQGTYIRIIKE